MFSPHTVTLFSVSEDGVAPVITRTVLHNVFLDTTKASGVNSNGITNADSARLFIPLESHPDIDDIPVKGRLSCADSYFIKGEITTNVTYSDAKKTYKNTYRISRALLRDFGSPDMHHWDVGGV